MITRASRSGVKKRVVNTPFCRRMLSLVALSLACAASVPTPSGRPNNGVPKQREATAQVIGDLGWLAGAWTTVEGDPRTEERWSPPSGGTMLGTSRTIAGEGTVFFEYLRIEAVDGSLTYFASPKGSCPPIAFPLAASGADWVRFENPEHDDPKAITYRREGASLVAEIEGPDRRVMWRFAPADG